MLASTTVKRFYASIIIQFLCTTKFCGSVNIQAASSRVFSRLRLFSMLQLSQIISSYSSKCRIKVKYNLLRERLCILNLCLRSAHSHLKALS